MLIRMKFFEVEANLEGFYIGVGRDLGGGRQTAAYFDFMGNGLTAIDWRGRQVFGRK